MINIFGLSEFVSVERQHNTVTNIEKPLGIEIGVKTGDTTTFAVVSIRIFKEDHIEHHLQALVTKFQLDQFIKEATELKAKLTQYPEDMKYIDKDGNVKT